VLAESRAFRKLLPNIQVKQPEKKEVVVDNVMERARRHGNDWLGESLSIVAEEFKESALVTPTGKRLDVESLPEMLWNAVEPNAVGAVQRHQHKWAEKKDERVDANSMWATASDANRPLNSSRTLVELRSETGFGGRGSLMLSARAGIKPEPLSMASARQHPSAPLRGEPLRKGESASTQSSVLHSARVVTAAHARRRSNEFNPEGVDMQAVCRRSTAVNPEGGHSAPKAATAQPEPIPQSATLDQGHKLDAISEDDDVGAGVFLAMAPRPISVIARAAASGAAALAPAGGSLSTGDTETHAELSA